MATKSKELSLDIRGFDPNFTIEVSKEGKLLRSGIIEESGFLVVKDSAAIATAEDKDTAEDLIQRCRNFERSVESAREAVKKPVLESGRRIDSEARNAVAEIVKIRQALESGLAAYVRRKLEEQRKQQEEAERKERERLAAEAEFAEPAPEEEFQETTATATPAPISAPQVVVTPNQAAGLSSVKFVEKLVFEVVDPMALVGFKDGLFVDIKPRTGELNALINMPDNRRLFDAGRLRIPGLKISLDQGIASRAQPTPKPDDPSPFD